MPKVKTPPHVAKDARQRLPVYVSRDCRTKLERLRKLYHSNGTPGSGPSLKDIVEFAVERLFKDFTAPRK